MPTIWKDVKKFEGLYQVSNKGEVRSVDRVVVNRLGRKRFFKGRVLTQYTDKYGYHVVGLRDRDRKITAKVHRLVALSFLPGVAEGYTVNHKDFNRKNNLIENLEWLSPEENVKYSHVNNRYPVGECSGRAKLSDEDVKNMRHLYKTYGKPNKIAEQFNVSRSTVHRIVTNKMRKTI